MIVEATIILFNACGSVALGNNCPSGVLLLL